MAYDNPTPLTFTATHPDRPGVAAWSFLYGEIAGVATTVADQTVTLHLPAPRPGTAGSVEAHVGCEHLPSGVCFPVRFDPNGMVETFVAGGEAAVSAVLSALLDP